jgi:cobalt-zinc-cadmium efflux system protein
MATLDTDCHHRDTSAHPAPAAAADDQRRLLGALWLTGGFTLVEVVGGLLSGSLALLADAGHMLSDTAALGLACIAVRVARRPADVHRTYGYHRFPVLAAFVNAVTLLLIVGWIAVEAVGRLRQPLGILEGPMLAVAAVGLLVNLAAFRLLHGGQSSSLNVRGAVVHVLGDLAGSAAAVVAALVILVTGWTPIDPILSLVVALLVLRSALPLLRRSAHVLMEGRPEDIDAAEVARRVMRAVPEVSDVHHVHIWSLTPGRPLVTFHARVDRGAVHDRALQRVRACLRERFGVLHETVQLEHERCVDPAGCTGS